MFGRPGSGPWEVEGTIIDKAQMRTRYVLWTAYPMAAALILTPLLDVFSRTWPLRLTEVGWRFGSAGILLNTLVTPLLGLFLAVAAAALLDHRLTVRILSILGYVVAALLVLGMGLFVLDFLQVRSEVAPDNRGQFTAPTVKALLVGTVGAVVALWMARGAQQAVKRRGPR